MKRKTSVLTTGCGCVALFFLGIPLFGLFISAFQPTRPDQTARPTHAARPAKVPARIYPEALFNAWDGSNERLVRYVQDRMNDPDSFEHAETIFFERGDYLFVTMKYRGKNGFGGVITNYINAKIYRSGDIIDVLDDDEAIAQAYTLSETIAKPKSVQPISASTTSKVAPSTNDETARHPILAANKAHDWTYLDGRPFACGVYLGYKPTDVWVMTVDGDVLKTPLFGLSKANQDFVRKEIKDGRKAHLIPKIEEEGLIPASGFALSADAPTIKYEIVKTGKARTDKAPVFYVLIKNVDLESPVFKDNIKKLVKHLVSKHGRKLSIEIFDSSEAVELAFSQYGDYSLQRSLSVTEKESQSRHHICSFLGELTVEASPHILCFFPAAVTSNAVVGKFVESLDFKP